MDVKEKIINYVKNHPEIIRVNDSVFENPETLFIDSTDFMRKKGKSLEVENRKYGWLKIIPGNKFVRDDSVPGFPYRSDMRFEGEENNSGSKRFAFIWFSEESGFGGEVFLVEQECKSE